LPEGGPIDDEGGGGGYLDWAPTTTAAAAVETTKTNELDRQWHLAGAVYDDDDDDIREETPTTPVMLLPIGQEENEEDEVDAFAFSKYASRDLRHSVRPTIFFSHCRRSTLIPSRSGCWSSFSWSSLYDERRTESSLSWADDVSLTIIY
jgi:hypothetical protein